jgi:hypothetical protein
MSNKRAKHLTPAEASYDKWFRDGVQAAIDDPRPSIPHEQVMARVDERLKRLREISASRNTNIDCQ